MRVVVYCDVNSRGGVWAYTIALSEQLRQLGARVHILTHAPNSPLQRSIGETLLAAADSHTILPNNQSDATDIENLARALVDCGAQIYIPNYRQNPYGAFVRLGANAPLQCLGVCHNNNEPAYGLLSRYNPVISRFVCASQTTLAELSRRCPERAADIRHIAHGVRVPRERCAPFEGGTLKLIYHGRLCEEQKRIARMLDVADVLLERDVPFSLELIGEGADVETYRRRIADTRLRQFVTLTPGTDWGELVEKLRTSHVALLTSEYEGFCFSLAEGMGCGLPGVAFQTGGIIEEYLHEGRNGYLLAQNDVTGMAAALSRLQQQPALWRSLSEAARATIIDRYSWESAARLYLQLFEDMLRLPHRSSWPALRPAWIPPDRRSWRSILESIGTRAHLWR